MKRNKTVVREQRKFHNKAMGINHNKGKYFKKIRQKRKQMFKLLQAIESEVIT